MTDGLVTVLDGNTFVVSDRCGDVDASATDPAGLFSFDTRFLSRWVLTIDGQRLNSLSVDDLQYFETRFFLVPGTGTVYVDAKLSVIRQRAVGGGFHERLTLLNHDAEAVDVVVRIEAAADFADLFEIKDALRKQGRSTARGDDGVLLLGYRRGAYERSTAISAVPPADADEAGLTFAAHVEPHDEWHAEIDVAITLPAGARRSRRGVVRAAGPGATMQRDLDRWVDAAPRLECDWEPLGSRTGAASSTSRRCASRRRSRRDGTSPRPACRGS